MTHFWNFFLKNKNFSYIILVALIILGAYSLIVIPKESAPEVQIPVAVISVAYPGASAIDIERLVTNKIEEQLINGLNNVNKVTSNSRDGISVVTVEFDASADIDKSIQDTKDEVDKVKPDLPEDALDPIVSDVNFVDQPIMTVSLLSDLSDLELISLVDEVEAEIKKVSGVSKIQLSGLPEREAQVIVKKELLDQYNLSIVDIVRAIGQSNSSLPVGSIEMNGVNYGVAFKGNIESTSEIRDIAILNSGGQPVYIRDIATVVDGVSDRSTYARVSLENEPSQKAVNLAVYKRGGGDITQISDGVKEKLETLKDGLLEDTPYLVSFDSGDYVKKDLIELSSSALQTIALVMIVLFLSLGWREALVAGLSVPVSFLAAFIILYYSGNTINFISLFSLILSVGILVDSAIVIVESIHANMKSGGDKTEAARKTIFEFHYPLTTGTLTSVAVFAPLFMLSGVVGQFISSIPFTTIAVLMASIFVALAIVPVIALAVLKRRNTTKLEDKQEEYKKKIEAWYVKFLSGIVGNKHKEKKFFRILTLLMIISMILPFTGLVKVIFFPQEDIDFMFIDIETNQGTTLEQTDIAVRQVEEAIYGNDYIDSFVTEVGRASAYGFSGGAGEHTANITLLLNEDRKITSTEALDKLRASLNGFDTFSVKAFQPNNGPASGAPVNIKFFGDNLDDINYSVRQGEDLLASIEGAVEVGSSAKTDATEFQLNIDRAKASQFGLDSQSVAFALRTAIFGTEATTINDIAGDIKVIVKQDLSLDNTIDNTTLTNIEAIKKLTLQTPSGPILVGSIVSDDVGISNTTIAHEDNRRVGFVSSEISGKATAGQIVSEFMSRQNELNLPAGVEIAVGGETEDTNKTFSEMLIALAIGVVLISGILVLQFNSFRHAFYIVAIIPLSLIGVMFGLALFGKTFSFPSIMGFIALAGIVVNNSIILIDSINLHRKLDPSKDIRTVVIESSATRLRPILLTTITTVIGSIPLAYVSELWAPLAYAIIFGLSFSVVISLILVPILYNRKPGEVMN